MTSADQWTDEQLLSRMLLRNGRAWREFHSRFDRLVYRCIHRITSRFPNAVSAEDGREIYAMFLLGLNQRNMHKLRSFDPARGCQLSSWLGMLATRCAWDFLRNVSRQPTCSPLVDAEQISSERNTPHDDLLTKERWGVVNRALRTFSERDQDFVRLYYVDGLSAEQVADELQISVKTVYSKKHKIRARLQLALAPALNAA